MSTQANLRDQVKTFEQELDRLYDLWEKSLKTVDALGEVTVTEEDALQISLILGV